MESFFQITQNEAESYSQMKKQLNFKDDEQFLKYLKVKTINAFN